MPKCESGIALNCDADNAPYELLDGRHVCVHCLDFSDGSRNPKKEPLRGYLIPRDATFDAGHDPRNWDGFAVTVK